MEPAVAQKLPLQKSDFDLTLRRLQFTSVLCAVAVILVAAAVLVGWALDLEALKRVLPNLTAMNPVSACAFITAGVALLHSQARKSGGDAWRAVVTTLLSAVVMLVGASKLVAITWEWDIGVDRLLFASHMTTGGINHAANEMAPNTAFNFLLVGIALLLLRFRGRGAHRVAESLATIAAFGGLFALIGYAYGSPTFYGVGTFTPMALHSAFAFIFLAVGILLSRADEGITAIVASDTSGGIVARRLLPLAIGLPIMLGALALAGARRGWYDTEFAAVMNVTLLVLLFVGLSWWIAHKLFRLDLQHRELERVRHEQDERLRQMAEHIEDVFWMTSRDGHEVLYVSPAYEKIWGRSCEALYLQPWEWSDSIHEEDRERVLNAFIEKAPSGGYAEEFRIVRPDGTIRWIRARGYPVRDDSGAVYRIAGIATDLTERKEAERALREAQADAERANQAKSEFLSRMSHELRTPLNAILGFGQLLELEELSADQKESASHIVRAGHHLLDLINEVLDISRIEAGRMAVSLEPVSLSEVLRDGITLLGPLAAEQEIKIEQGNGDTGDLFVTADRQRLKQVILNLLSNAIKYNRIGGGVRITTASSARSYGRVVRIGITDTGSGIPAEKFGQLFTPFERLGAENTSVDGTGLGLALSKRLVEVMNGRIGVESEPGVGSTFWIELAETENPLRRVESAPADVHVTPVPTRATVLYIEDNPSNLRLVERIVARRPEIKLVPSQNGHDGIALARAEQPNLILLDLHLPDIHGEEVLKRLRSEGATAEIPIVIVSADATPNQVKRLKAAGAQYYLTKPIEVGRFLNIIDELLQAARIEEVR